MRSKALEPISFEWTCQRCGKSCEAEAMRGTYINFRGEIISPEEAERANREAVEGVMALLQLR